MPIPDDQTWMLPLLQYAADGGDHRFRDTVTALADKLGHPAAGALLADGARDANRVWRNS